MVRGMWYDPETKVFGCRGHSKCFKKCLLGKGSASKDNPNCGAFQPPQWAIWFVCPRFVYRKGEGGRWECVEDKLGLIAPVRAELPENIRELREEMDEGAPPLVPA